MPSATRALALLLLAGAAACQPAPAPPDFVARLDDQYLTRDEVASALTSVPPQQDSMEALQQVVEQWITNELLYQEALERDLDQDPEVRRLLEESQRSVLVSALIAKMYEENPGTPTPAEVQDYFDRNREQLRLLEPYVRVRYLSTDSAGAAAEARRALLQAREAERDSVWRVVVARYADDPAGAQALAERYVAESRVLLNVPAVRQALLRLGKGQIAPVVQGDSLYHVLQLVDRAPAGTIPEPSWIEEELVRRLMIEGRKQLYARQVQRLRTEALAREALEIRQ